MKTIFFPLILSLFILAGLPDLSTAEDINSDRNRVLWESLSADEKERIRENYRALKAQSSEKQQQIEKNYKYYHELSVEEKYRLKERYRAYHGLDPSVKERVNEHLKAIDSLPQENKKRLRKKYERIREKPVEEQMKDLEQSDFWKGLSERDKELFRNLIFPHTHQ